MSMFNPPHPGQFIKEVYIDELEISERSIAEKLNVSPSTFNRLVQCKASVSPEMALRLSITLGRTPESWLAMQDSYSLWEAKNSLDLSKVQQLKIA